MPAVTAADECKLKLKVDEALPQILCPVRHFCQMWQKSFLT